MIVPATPSWKTVALERYGACSKIPDDVWDDFDRRKERIASP